MIVQLNDRWRVTHDPLQWILQARKSRETVRHTGYYGRSYCRSRTALIRCIGEYCGEVDPAALAIVESWPERFAEFDASPLAAAA